MLTVIALIVLVGSLFFVWLRYGVIGVMHDKLDRDGHLRLPGYNMLTGRWTDEDPDRPAEPK